MIFVLMILKFNVNLLQISEMMILLIDQILPTGKTFYMTINL